MGFSAARPASFRGWIRRSQGAEQFPCPKELTASEFQFQAGQLERRKGDIMALSTRIAKKSAFVALVGSLLILAGLAVAQPKTNVSAGKHPNLAAAQRFSQQAYTKIIAAQEANEWDMQGHAQKAKGLLDQVNSELKLAAGAANKK
jgi:hypothetical protein